MKRQFRRILLIAILGLTGHFVFAQKQASLPQFASWGGGPFDSINLGNLGVHFTIPVLHKAGLGTPFAYDISYEGGQLWSAVSVNGTLQWQPNSTFGWTNTSGGGAGGYISYDTITTSGQCPINPPYQFGTYTQVEYLDFVYHDNYGFSHIIPAQVYYITNPQCPSIPNGQQPSPPQVYQATDGSGFSAYIGATNSAPYGYVIAKDGTQISAQFSSSAPSGGSWSSTDTNGNMITESAGAWTDTLGLQVLAITGTVPTTALTYTAPSGASASYKIGYTNYTVRTWFQMTSPTVTEYGPLAQNLISYIALPDDTPTTPHRYTFTYESTPSGASCTPLSGTALCVTARIASITLPTGGTITYSYSGGPSGKGIEHDGTVAGLTRVLNPGGTWAYVRSGGSPWTTTITDPASNQTVLSFYTGTYTSDSSTYYEVQRQSYQGSISSTPCSQTVTNNCLLKTIVTCYNSTSCSSAIYAPIGEKITYTQIPNSSGLQSETDVTYNGVGLVTGVSSYDYGTGSVGPLIRSTGITYGSYSGGSCVGLGNNIFDRPCKISTADASGHILSKTTYTYDQGTPASAPGRPRFTAVTGSRGNQTTVTQWINSTQSLSSTTTYYETGTPNVATDVNSAQTTYVYGTGSCGYVFPTQINMPLSLSTSATWDCLGGVQKTSTDVNGKITTTTYNDTLYWRPASITDPANAITNFLYRTTNQGAVESYMLFNTNNSSIAEQMTSVDGFGRPTVSQQQAAPGGGASFNTTELDYDALGRPARSTMPYSTTTYGGTNSSVPATMTTYDALGSPIQTTDGGGGYVKYTYSQNDVLQEIGPAPLTKKQLQYDALGRLTSVCELTSLPGYVNCGQTNSYNGYLTTYAYGVNGAGYSTTTVTQGPSGSQQTRVYTYDLIGRLISEQNPENGTTSYFYDSDPGTPGAACSTISTLFGWPATSNGDLRKKYDAKGNTTCFTYDSLHRVTSTTYAGPDSSATPMKVFYYDTGHFNTTSNSKGRLASAGTCSNPTCAGAWITGEDFSYSARGELTDVYEFTPHSSGTYHVTAAYWANGALNTLSSNISGLPSQGYGVDSMGRPYSVTASSGQNPVTATSYNVSTLTSSVTFGSGDSDSFYQDLNTGRQTKYVFNVNGATNTGQTNWNQNGSLGSFQITDNISGTSDTQTCNYTHDDLARIASVNCANGSTTKWTQSFTYDRFGNITKSSSGPGIAFTPGYQASTNWITSLPGITPTTDANGRMTYDGTHNYSWDADSKMVAVDSTTLTYDAMGRMVEKSSGGTYTQIAYGPQGRFATMSAQTLVKAFVPLPGGATAVYTSAGFAYYRHSDDLGSSRLATALNRTLYSSTAYAPFGEPYAQAGTTDLSFTGQDTDTIPVTTNGTNPAMYDFLMRKQSPVQGRWLSPDPAGLAAVDPTNPQGWNRYAYVMNNPLTLVDPLGLADDDCPGGCTPISYQLGGGCYETITYSLDGNNYHIPNFDFYCQSMPGMLSHEMSCTLINTYGGMAGMSCINTSPGAQAGTTTNCISANFFTAAAAKVLSAVSSFTGRTTGYGLGGSTGAGVKKFGFNFSASRQLVVAPDGTAGIATTYTKQLFGVASGGYSGVGGAQFSSSTVQTVSDLSGVSVDFGGMAGDELAAGFDASFSVDSKGAPTMQVTGTLGFGFGEYGHGGQLTITSVTPLCKH